jgi:hypothetical protein
MPPIDLPNLPYLQECQCKTQTWLLDCLGGYETTGTFQYFPTRMMTLMRKILFLSNMVDPISFVWIEEKKVLSQSNFDKAVETVPASLQGL